MAFFSAGQTTKDAPIVVRETASQPFVARPPEQRRNPAAPPKLTPHIDCDVMDETAIAEYIAVAEQVGIDPQDMEVERFRVFLAKHDIPTFNLKEVVSYMDDLVAKDNPTGLGWHWCPVRERDSAAYSMTWGRRSEDWRQYGSRMVLPEGQKMLTPASDFYESSRFGELRQAQREGHNIDATRLLSPAYSRTIPLHALKKIALIEREFGTGKAVFLVTEYTTQPHVVVNPDPFLMAVIPNSAVAHGKGRFIIDVWDEPGFGISRMVK